MLAIHAKKEDGRTREVDGAVVVRVHLVDHVLQLRLAGVLAERAHDGPELFGGDLPIAVLVLRRSVRVAGAGVGAGAKAGSTHEEGEGFLELGDLLLGERVGLDAS
jgi:hypothetical protein